MSTYLNVQNVAVQVNDDDCLFTMTGPFGEVRVFFKNGECYTFYKKYDSNDNVFKQECHYIYANFPSSEHASYTISEDAKRLVGIEDLNLMPIIMGNVVYGG